MTAVGCDRRNEEPAFAAARIRPATSWAAESEIAMIGTSDYAPPYPIFKPACNCWLKFRTRLSRTWFSQNKPSAGGSSKEGPVHLSSTAARAIDGRDAYLAPNRRRPGRIVSVMAPARPSPR
jgi:hypothetical protein